MMLCKLERNKNALRHLVAKAQNSNLCFMPPTQKIKYLLILKEIVGFKKD